MTAFDSAFTYVDGGGLERLSRGVRGRMSYVALQGLWNGDDPGFWLPDRQEHLRVALISQVKVRDKATIPRVLAVA